MLRTNALALLALVASCKVQEGTVPPDLAAVRDLAPPPANVTGRVVDDQGAPRGNVLCQLCSKQICLQGRTGVDGRIGFVAQRVGEYHFRAFSDEPITFGDVFFPVPITTDPKAEGFQIALGDQLIAPAAGSGQAVTVAQGGTFQFPDGVTLEVPAGALTLADFAETGTLFGLAVPMPKVAAQLLASRAGQVAGVFLTMPFGALCNKAGGKACGVSWPAAGLSDGTALTLTMPNFDTGVLEVVGQATVTGGRVVSTPTSGLPALGWVVAYR